MITLGIRLIFSPASIFKITMIICWLDRLSYRKIGPDSADLDKIPNSRKKQNEYREISSQIETFTVRLAGAKDWTAQYGTEDIDLAASLFIYTPQEMVYLFSGSLTEFNKFYAPVALQEYAMRKALDLKIPFYNFLRYSRRF